MTGEREMKRALRMLIGLLVAGSMVMLSCGQLGKGSAGRSPWSSADDVQKFMSGANTNTQPTDSVPIASADLPPPAATLADAPGSEVLAAMESIVPAEYKISGVTAALTSTSSNKIYSLAFTIRVLGFNATKALNPSVQVYLNIRHKDGSYELAGVLFERYVERMLDGTEVPPAEVDVANFPRSRSFKVQYPIFPDDAIASAKMELLVRPESGNGSIGYHIEQVDSTLRR